jgi:hypothetical protein
VNCKPKIAPALRKKARRKKENNNNNNSRPFYLPPINIPNAVYQQFGQLSAGRVTCAGLAADQVFHFQCSN